MKKYNYIKGVLASAVMLMLPACSSDYLDTKPEANVSDSQALGTADNIQLAINGICMSMMTQYQSTEWNQYNGELYINTLCNDAIGQDYINGLASAGFGNNYVNGTGWIDTNSFLFMLPWNYCYGIINQANKILDVVDQAQGTEEKLAWVKAQALTFRAHAYTKLVSMFAPRWEDSNNGNAYCVVLRTTGKVENFPLATMNDALALIYSDLDQAIALYEKAGDIKRTMKWQPDMSIAKGTYARAALIKNDWAKAQQMAHEARQGYEIMDNATYLSGFYTDNNDFMWISSSLDADIYYWSWGSHYAANGWYTYKWEVGSAGAIDLDLYNQMDEKDIRRQCYLTPDKVDFINEVQPSWNRAGVTQEYFWNPDLVGEANNLTLNQGPASKALAVNGKWGLYNIAVRYCQYYLENIFTGDINDIARKDETTGDMVYAYYTASGQGDMLIGKGVYGVLWITPIGANLKFMSKAPYGVGAYHYMRASEMCLAEAEAAYKNGDETTAKSCLEEINSKRIPGYSCTTSGDALYEEIKLTRRIELWGEGQNFTDFKRWNMPIDRRKWIANDPTSGNWLAERSAYIPTSYMNGWAFQVPKSESDYNPLIDRSLIPMVTPMELKK